MNRKFLSFFESLFIKFVQICIPFTIGIIVTWSIRWYLISKGLNLNVFLDFYFVTSVAYYISFVIKEGTREFLVTYTLTSGAGDNNMADLGNTTESKPVVNKPGENSGVGNNGEDTNQPVANTQQYISSGPDKYISEKEEILKLTGDFYPPIQRGPLERALKLFGAYAPEKYLSDNFHEKGIQMEKNALFELNKVKDYFDAIDAGREPTDEAIKAFKERQKRYLAYPYSDNWKGPFIDFNDPSNVRRDALVDLEQIKSNMDINNMIVKTFANEKFAEGPAAKANFYKRLDEVFHEHFIKHEEFFKNKASQERAFYDTWDKKSIFWLLELETKQRQQYYNHRLNGWIAEKSNKDLFQKWSQDKINQDFIEKWLGDNKNIK